MNETGGNPTPALDRGASANVRTLADELHDAQAINAAIYRVNALAEGVRALADPDAHDMPGPTDWDRTMRAIEGLARMIGEVTEDAMEPSGEALLAARIRAEGVRS